MEDENPIPITTNGWKIREQLGYVFDNEGMTM